MDSRNSDYFLVVFLTTIIYFWPIPARAGETPAASLQTSSASQPAAACLKAAGINTLQEAEARLADIAAAVKAEGPQLTVHLVNWYKYDPQDMRKSLYWNGDAGQGGGRVVLEPKPLFGYYSCDDPQIIEWELQISQALGVTELNVDYEGGVDYPREFAGYYQKRFWDRWFPELLRRAEKYPVKISVMYEPKSIAPRLALRAHLTLQQMQKEPDYARQAAELLKDDLRRICDKFTLATAEQGRTKVNAAYKRVAGLPEIGVFHLTASGLTHALWAQAIQELRNEGYVFVLIPNAYRENQAEFDDLIQGLNPWLDQIFTGMIDHYPELWQAAQAAAKSGDRALARRLTHQFIDELAKKGLGTVAPVRTVSGAAHFNVAPLMANFQDAAVDAWGFRPPVYFEADDRTRTEPGKLFRAFFLAARQSPATKWLVATGDDMPEKTHLLIPDEEFGFSGVYALALAATAQGRRPDLRLAIQLTAELVARRNHGKIPDHILAIIREAEQVLPGKLETEARSLAPNAHEPNGRAQ